MEGSSGSEDEEEEEIEEQAEKEDTCRLDEKAVAGKRKPGAEEEIPESYLLKKIKVEPGTEDNSTGAGKSTDTGKSVLELLELEMRARIIKTMLEKGQDGSKIAEDAIAAVMQSAKQITGEDPMQVKDSESIDKIGGREEGQNDDIEVESNNEEERSRSSRKKHRRRYASKDNGRRRRERDRSQENRELSHRSKRESKSKSKSDTHTIQRKKITRKEFQERMKRAKKNRTYRQRKTSEDEEKEKDNGGEDDLQKNDADNQSERNSESRKKITDVGETGPEGKSQEEREEGDDVEGSEKEEGEIDSNEEEEEGACSPSDVSSYSSCCSYTRSYSSSRSRSRSYTRSPSPYRKRSRSRGRSYSHSRSRSPVYKRRHRKANYPQSRSADNWTKNEKCKSYIKKDEKPGISKDSSSSKEAIKPSQPAEPREEEENWGQKCDIEFVDSDEDFDDNPDESRKLQPGAVSQASERASISFSLQKKSAPNITPGIDLDDLPRKKSQRKECTTEPDVGVVAMVEQPKKTSEEIVISSDSEGETLKSSCSALPSKSKQKETLSNNQSDHISVLDKTKQHSGIISDIDGKITQPVSVSPQISGTSISRAIEVQSEKVEKYDNTIQSETAEKVVHGIEESDPKVQSTSDSDIPRNMRQTSETSESVLSDKPAVLEGSESNYITDSSVSEQDVQSKALDYADKVIVSESLNTADSVQDYEYDSHCISQKTEELNVSDSASNSQENFDNSKESQSEKLEPKVSQMEGSCCEKLDLKTSEGKGGLSERLDIKMLESNGGQVDKVEVKRSQSEKTEETLPESKGIHNENLQTENSETVKEPGHAESQISVRERNVYIQDSDTCDSDNGNELNEIKSAPINVSVMNTESISEEGKLHTNEEILSSSPQIETCTEIIAICDTDNENKTEEKNTKHPPNDTNNENRAVVENIKQQTDNTHAYENRKSGCTFSNEDNNAGQITETEEDFYRGADLLKFSDDDETSHDHEEFLRDDMPVEPIRIETGLISKPVVRREKTKNVAPEVSWTRKEKKKKEKTKGQLAMEGIGLIKSTLAENSAPPLAEIYETQSTDSDTGKPHCRTECTVPSTPQMQETHLVDINHETQDPKSDEGFKQSDQETEIIGVIETSNDAGQNPVDDIDLGGASWSMRWLQSEKVQKVVSSSKMLSRVRKKIQRKGKQAKVVVEKTEEVQQLPQPQVSVIGSIEEYERLFGMKVKANTEVTTATTSSTHETVTTTTSSLKTETESKAAPIFGSEDEGEDSEEEALWSKILKK